VEERRPEGPARPAASPYHERPSQETGNRNQTDGNIEHRTLNIEHRMNTVAQAPACLCSVTAENTRSAEKIKAVPAPTQLSSKLTPQATKPFPLHCNPSESFSFARIFQAVCWNAHLIRELAPEATT